MNDLDMFLGAWERESESTLKLLRALPAAQYDFRPDAGGRSLGELAWHLAEGDAYMSYGIENGTFGICEICEEEISVKRLEARPVTTMCIRCKEEQEKQEKSYG